MLRMYEIPPYFPKKHSRYYKIITVVQTFCKSVPAAKTAKEFLKNWRRAKNLPCLWRAGRSKEKKKSRRFDEALSIFFTNTCFMKL